MIKRANKIITSLGPRGPRLIKTFWGCTSKAVVAGHSVPLLEHGACLLAEAKRREAPKPRSPEVSRCWANFWMI